MLYLQNGTITSSPGFTAGTPGDCSSSSSAALCQYAGFNGYTPTTSAAGWGAGTPGGAVAVNWTFPSSVTGVATPSGIAYPYLNVVVHEKPSTWFMGMVEEISLPSAPPVPVGCPPALRRRPSSSSTPPSVPP